MRDNNTTECLGARMKDLGGFVRISSSISCEAKTTPQFLFTHLSANSRKANS